MSYGLGTVGLKPEHKLFPGDIVVSLVGMQMWETERMRGRGPIFPQGKLATVVYVQPVGYGIRVRLLTTDCTLFYTSMRDNVIQYNWRVVVPVNRSESW